MSNRLSLQRLNALFNLKHLSEYNLVIFQELCSTNSKLLENLELYPHKTILITEKQIQGKGRQQKSWVSEPFVDLTLSILYKFSVDFIHELMPLVMAVAIIRLLKMYGVKAQIKWPNDIYLLANRQKISGILVESRFIDNPSLNSNMNNQVSPSIGSTALSKFLRGVVIGIGLDNIWGYERNELLADLILHVDTVIKEYEIFGFSLLRQEWVDNCIHYMQPIQILQNDKVVDKGICLGLNIDGKIQIKSELANHQIKSYSPTSILI